MKKRNLPENEPFLILRDDGFSQFCERDAADYSIEDFLEHNVGYLRDYPGVKIKLIGIGPGSVFAYDTKVGEVFMQNVSPLAEKVCRPCDIQARDMIQKCIDAGSDGLSLMAAKCREMDIIPWARFEMNHEYGPCSEDNFTYACFVGKFNKEHPEYRIPKPDGTPAVYPFLDFKHKEVRDFKLAIIREVAAHDIDGMELDFCVYPPFFFDPKADGHFMTDLIRDARRVLDEEGEKRGVHIDLAVRIEPDAEERLYMAWRDWVREGLIDWIVPSYRSATMAFDVPVEPFLKECAGTKCRVATHIMSHGNRITTDPNPNDIRSGLTGVKDRPILPRRHYAKAFAGIKAGANALVIATSGGSMTGKKNATWHPLLDTLADFDFLRRAEKEYCFDYGGKQPAELTRENNPYTHSVMIGDEPADIETATFILYARGLTALESVILTVNGHEMTLTEEHLHWSPDDEPILPSKERGTISGYNRLHLARIDKWWDICKNEIDIPPSFLRRGKNTVTLTYKIAEGGVTKRPLNVGDLAFIIQPK